MQRRSRTAAGQVLKQIEALGIQVIPRGDAAYIQGPLGPDQAGELAALLPKLREHWLDALATLAGRDEVGSAAASMRVLIARTESDAPKNPAAVALGLLGGSKGGKIRAERLSKKRRQEIGRKAAEARWAKK